MSSGRSRPPAEQRIGNEARKAWAAIGRAEELAARAVNEAKVAEERFEMLLLAAEAKFNRPIPCDPVLLDVLAQIEVRGGDYWHWLGIRNNHGLATFRVHAEKRHNGTELSVVRYLAISFGIVSATDNGALYPLNGRDDVNPWHRRLRRSVAPIGPSVGENRFHKNL